MVRIAEIQRICKTCWISVKLWHVKIEFAFCCVKICVGPSQRSYDIRSTSKQVLFAFVGASSMLPGPTGPTEPTPVGPTGPLVPSMSTGHTDVPMPFAQMTVPGYVPTAEAQQSEVPKGQATWQHVEMLRRLVEILLLQWAWLKSWFDLVFNGLELDEKFDIRFLAPTVVIIVGIVMTNVLGFINFFLQGLHLDACMAAFDLDTPFLAYKHGAQVVKGEDCPEWEKLRMRNSIWRSLPLAMITLILQMRNLFEIPTCQVFTMVGPLATSVVPDLSLQSRFIQDILVRNAKFDYSAMGQVQNFHEAASNIPPESREKFRPTVRILLDLEKDVWGAAHCSESTWEETRMLRKQDVSEHWLMGYPVDLDHVELGGIGSGNIASFNAIFFEKYMSEMENSGDEIKTMLKKRLRLFSSKLVLKLPFGVLLRTAILGLYKTLRNEPQSTVVQSRPWNLNIGDLVHLEIKSGWKVRVLQACGLLLVAALPMLKKILAACKVAPGQLFIKSMVALYIFVDVAALVVAWLLCAAAPMAYHAGAALKAAASAAGPMVVQVLQDGEAMSVEHFKASLPAKLIALLQDVDRIPSLISSLKDNFVPAVQWDVPFFLEPAGGSLLFVAASAVLAVVLCGAHWSAGVSAGVCGPLWLVSKDTKSREGQVGSSRGLYFMMVSRSLLLAGIVVLKWKVVDSVDVFSFQIFFALICNRILSIKQATYWWTCWVALCAVHCLFGLAAAYAAKKNLEESSEVLTAEDDWQPTYGTFDPAVWTCKAGNLSETLIRLISIRKAALSTVANMTHVCLLDSWTQTTIPLFPSFRRMLPICQAHSFGDFPSWLNHDYFTFISLLILCPWKSFGPLPRFARPCGFASSAPDVKTWALWPMDQKHGASEYVSRKVFFHKKIQATFDVQVLFECSNSSHAGLKRHFDMEKNCGDSDFVMVSPIYVSVIPPWLRLWIETK